jgi:hypothetical protein
MVEIFQVSNTTRGTCWFDEYRDEEMAIINELKPAKIAYDALLMLTDGYMCKVSVKCSY